MGCTCGLCEKIAEMRTIGYARERIKQAYEWADKYDRTDGWPGINAMPMTRRLIRKSVRWNIRQMRADLEHTEAFMRCQLGTFYREDEYADLWRRFPPAACAALHQGF